MEVPLVERESSLERVRGSLVVLAARSFVRPFVSPNFNFPSSLPQLNSPIRNPTRPPVPPLRKVTMTNRSGRLRKAFNTLLLLPSVFFQVGCFFLELSCSSWKWDQNRRGGGREGHSRPFLLPIPRRRETPSFCPKLQEKGEGEREKEQKPSNFIHVEKEEEEERKEEVENFLGAKRRGEDEDESILLNRIPLASLSFTPFLSRSFSLFLWPSFLQFHIREKRRRKEKWREKEANLP